MAKARTACMSYKQLVKYFSGNTKEPFTSQIKEHLDSCKECRQRITRALEASEEAPEEDDSTGSLFMGPQE